MERYLIMDLMMKIVNQKQRRQRRPQQQQQQIQVQFQQKNPFDHILVCQKTMMMGCRSLHQTQLYVHIIINL